MSDPFSAGQIDWEDEVAYLEATIGRQRETICLLGDILLAAFHSHSMWEQTPETRAAAKPLKDVIQTAESLMSGYSPDEGLFGNMWREADALLAALDHPAIAALIDAWAAGEG
jgi:hypothetical protein